MTGYLEGSPDNTENYLMKLINISRNLKEQPINENYLLKYRTPSPAMPITPIEERATFTGLPEMKPAVNLSLPQTTSPEIPIKPVTEPRTNALLDYWKQPIAGKMPLDQFVQVAGALGHAFAPETPMGRAGSVLSQIGGRAYEERLKYEEPENVLRKRLMEAQIKKFEKPEIPEKWQALWKELSTTINPSTGKIYTAGEALKEYHGLTEAPKEPKVPTPRTISTIQDGILGEFETTTKTFTPIRKATPKDIEDIETGKIQEPKTPYIRGQRQKFTGKDGMEYEGTFLGLDNKNEPQWGTVIKVAEKPKEYTEMQKIDDLRQVYEKEKSVVDATFGVSFDPLSKMIIGLDPSKRQDYANAITNLQKRYNRLGKMRNIKEPIFPVAGYGLQPLDVEDIAKLKQFDTPDKALSFVERAHRAGVIADETKNEATSLINQNRNQWDNWRRPSPLPEGQKLIPSHSPTNIYRDIKGTEIIPDPTSSTGWRYK